MDDDVGHKTQLIEIDKLIINNEPQQSKSSKNGVWHQVSSPSSEKNLFFNFFYMEKKNFFSVSHLMNVVVPLEKFSAHIKKLFSH